jgi:hypothetical protein
MYRRITNPPNMVLISGIPLCFAYGAYETTNRLAAPPNIIYMRLTSNGSTARMVKKRYDTTYPPAFEDTFNAVAQVCQSEQYSCSTIIGYILEKDST